LTFFPKKIDFFIYKFTIKQDYKKIGEYDWVRKKTLEVIRLEDDIKG